MDCVTHHAKYPRERLKNLHCRAEAVYQSPIAITVFLESLLPSLEKLEDSFWRIQLFERGSKWILREVYPSHFGVISQGIDDQLDVRGGRSRRHDDKCSSFSGDLNELLVREVMTMV